MRNAHSVHTIPSTDCRSQSGTGRSQDSRPQAGQVVSTQLLSFGSGMFFRNGIVKKPPLSEFLLGSKVIFTPLPPRALNPAGMAPEAAARH